MKLYVHEAGTERLLNLADRSNANRLAILSLARVEFSSAVRRRVKNGEIPTHIGSELIETLKRHIESRFVTQPVTDFVLDIAVELIDRYALRAFDAIQLAGYVFLKNSSGLNTPFFVCADHELLSAAQLEGAQILNPCA